MLSEIARTFVGAMYILGAVINLPYLTPGISRICQIRTHCSLQIIVKLNHNAVFDGVSRFSYSF